MSQTLQLTCCKTSVQLSHCRRKKKKERRKSNFISENMLFIYCCLNWLVCAISRLWFFLCFMIAFVMHENVSTSKMSFFWLVVHWLITTNSRVSSTAVCTWAGYTSVQADLQVSDNRGRCWNKRKKWYVQ